MHIRTFRAASLQAALAEIRRQMGPDASVLHTRQIRDGWMGWLGRTHVEVTAGLRDTSEAPSLVPMPSTLHSETDTRSLHPRSGASVPSPLREDALPPLLQNYRDQLLGAGVSLQMTDRWIEATMSFAASLGDPSTHQPWLEHLQRTVARELKLAGPIRTQPGERHVVALVGPTGVGKTTTVAKLAAGFRIQARRKVGLLTIDTFRIAAVQQLKAYAEIMDLPMEVVERPDQMQPALQRLGDVDLVLIDTAGRSPRSDARIGQLSQLLTAAKPDETHLVLSATSSPPTIRSVLDGFAPIHPTSAILTKLDETPHTAAVLSSLSHAGGGGAMALSYTTNGQQVPDDIAIACAETLVSRLLPSKITASYLEAA